MKALVLDIKREEWESTTGMSRVDIAQPQLDESKRPEDATRSSSNRFIRGSADRTRASGFATHSRI